ncbi:MAG: DsrE family protein [Stenotrophobium sp.]
MKLARFILLSLILISASAVAATQDAPDFWQTPALSGVGHMHPLPKAAYQPNPAETYKIVFAVTKGGAKPDEVSPSLERVARAVNLYASAGVPLDHLKFVAVLYGSATAAALDNAHYKQKFGVGNPNLEIISKLRAAGFDVAVCGQAVAENHFQFDWVASNVTLALSGITTITILQHQGYALVPL